MDETFEVIAPIVNSVFKDYPEWLRVKMAKDDPRFVFANDIPVELHLKTQAVWQKYVDSSISKTINLPNNATREDVKKAFALAYELGCKGFTVYRDGSRDTQVISNAEVKKLDMGKINSKPSIIVTTAEALKDVEPFVFENKKKRTRAKKLKGETTKYTTGCGNLYVTVNHDNGKIEEVFTNTGKTGGCPAQSEAITRLVATSLRCGVSGEEISKQLNGIRCMSCIGKNAEVKSCPNAIARSLIDFNSPDVAEVVEEIKNDSSPIVAPEKSIAIFACPDCGTQQEMYGNCAKCINCGFQKCSG
jgi:ribonucleoside-diphosphate reductase alpha chain